METFKQGKALSYIWRKMGRKVLTVLSRHYWLNGTSYVTFYCEQFGSCFLLHLSLLLSVRSEAPKVQASFSLAIRRDRDEHCLSCCEISEYLLLPAFSYQEGWYTIAALISCTICRMSFLFYIHFNSSGNYKYQILRRSLHFVTGSMCFE